MVDFGIWGENYREGSGRGYWLEVHNILHRKCIFVAKGLGVDIGHI